MIFGNVKLIQAQHNFEEEEKNTLECEYYENVFNRSNTNCNY